MSRQPERVTIEEFAAEYERQTGFDLMGRMDGDSDYQYARENIQWLRDWADETVRRLEYMAEGLDGSDDDE